MRLFLPVVGAALVMAVVLVAWLLWPQKKQPSTSVSPAKPVAQEGAKLVVEGGLAESTQMAVSSGEMNSNLPEHITLSMVQEIRESNGRKVLVFSDGSQLELTPYLTTQLSPEVRLRVEYRRDRP